MILSDWAVWDINLVYSHSVYVDRSEFVVVWLYACIYIVIIPTWQLYCCSSCTDLLAMPFLSVPWPECYFVQVIVVFTLHFVTAE